MEKGKLYLRETGEFIKECTQEDYLELAITTPDQYSFQPYSKPNPTIQDLNDFANSITNKNNTTSKHPKAKTKSQIWIVVKVLGAIAAIATILTFIFQLVK